MILFKKNKKSLNFHITNKCTIRFYIAHITVSPLTWVTHITLIIHNQRFTPCHNYISLFSLHQLLTSPKVLFCSHDKSQVLLTISIYLDTHAHYLDEPTPETQVSNGPQPLRKIYGDDPTPDSEVILKIVVCERQGREGGEGTRERRRGG